MICSDFRIKEITDKYKMINPFVDHQVREDKDGNRVISYGLSSMGYDIRLGHNFEVYHTKGKSADVVVSPKEFKRDVLLTESIEDGEKLIMSPYGCVLGLSLEYFRIPRNMIAVCFGKSTYARCGIYVNVTPLEPEWRGRLVIEIANNTSHPVELFPGEGIAQLLFFETDKSCDISYADRKGKYQDQHGIRLPLV